MINHPNRKKPRVRDGIVEAIAFTSGGAGNQFTTINGVKYATWWSTGNGIVVGAKVRFRPYRSPLWSGQPDTDCAEILGVYPKEGA